MANSALQPWNEVRSYGLSERAVPAHVRHRIVIPRRPQLLPRAGAVLFGRRAPLSSRRELGWVPSYAALDRIVADAFAWEEILSRSNRYDPAQDAR
jgi:hypothetical protein